MMREAIEEKFPRMLLGNFPSRVFTTKTHPNVWIKDDGSCSLIYSGNKIRKLEFILEKANRRGIKSLIVMGDQESHTVMSTGIIGKKYGFEVTAIIYRAHGQSHSSKSAQYLEGKGVQIYRCKSFITALFKARCLNILNKSYYVNLGATEALSNLGYVLAAFELQEQLNENLLPSPDFIYLPYATAGTISGLMIGLALLNSPIKIVGVRTVSGLIANRQRLIRLIDRTLSLMELATKISLESVLERLKIIDSTQVDWLYGAGNDSSIRAVMEAREFGLILEPVFSGKAFASLLREAEKFTDKRYLFWNTHDQNVRL